MRAARPSFGSLSALTLLLCSSTGSLGCERTAEPHASSAPVADRPTARTPPPVTERSAPPSEELAAPQEIELTTRDGFFLHGTLYPASTPSAAAVVLVHQLGTSRAEWDGLVTALRARPALTVLAFDLRGHGESTRSESGEISYGGFDTEAWAATSRDVEAAVSYLRSPLAPVQPTRIALVGSSIGSTAVVRAAAPDPSLDVLVLLSPGRAYRGVDGILPAVAMGPRALLAISASEEADAVETGAALARITSGRAETVDGHAHGVALFAEHEELVDTVARFLREALSAPPAAAPPATPTEGAPSPTAPEPR